MLREKPLAERGHGRRASLLDNLRDRITATRDRDQQFAGVPSRACRRQLNSWLFERP